MLYGILGTDQRPDQRIISWFHDFRFPPANMPAPDDTVVCILANIRIFPQLLGPATLNHCCALLLLYCRGGANQGMICTLETCNNGARVRRAVVEYHRQSSMRWHADGEAMPPCLIKPGIEIEFEID